MGIGLSLGLLGGGGSILTVPVLIYLLGQEPHAAIAASLVIVGANALTGAWLHWRQGNVRLQAALLFGIYGTGAAFLGARLSQALPGAVLLILFACLMLVVAFLMLRGGVHVEATGEAQQVAMWRVIAGGASVGFMTGFLGVGGGFLIVPALLLLLRMNMRQAIGSSLVVIALNSGAGLFGHLTAQGLPWGLIGLLIGGGLLGIALGARLVPRLPVARLRQGFALLVLLLAVVLLSLNIPAAIAA
jgi:uncharacterized protein